MRKVKTLNRYAPVILAAMSAIAAVLTMYVGRGTTFTGDEMTWIVASPGIDLETLLQSHGGHLQLIPRGLYKIMLETIGLEYWPYRLLTVLTVVAAAVLIYRYMIKRVEPAIALVPSAIMLFFGSDPLHVIRGNGFTIVFSVACGVAALLMLDRRDLKGDVSACALLVAGAATYTVALPFVVGAGLLLLLERNWRRLWIPVVPLALWAIWRAWLALTHDDRSGTGIDLGNVIHIPKWTFEALGASLSALTGLGYGFDRLSSAGPSDIFGPLLAALAIGCIVWRLLKGSLSPWIWVTLIIALALWSIQCLAAVPGSPDYRAPDDPRYLYPGAVVVILIGVELCAGRTWPKWGFGLLLAVGAFGVASNISQMERYADDYRLESDAMRRTITSAAIYLDEQRGYRAPTPDQPVIASETGSLIAAMAERPFGGVDYSASEIEELPPAAQSELDAMVGGYEQVALEPGGRPAGRCAVVKPDTAGRFIARLPAGRVVLKNGTEPATIRVGRFAETPGFDIGDLGAGRTATVETFEPVEAAPWNISSDQPGLEVCSA